MRCSEAWKLVEDCFDTSSAECVDFQRPDQIIANLIRVNVNAREAEVSTFPWEKKLLWPDAGRAKLHGAI